MISSIDRRVFMLGGLAAGASPRSAVAVDTAPFTSRRIAVMVRDGGDRPTRDVLLIPGLASGPGIWNGVLAGVPGYRYHLVQVAGFAGLPRQDNGSGPLLEPLTDEIARYVTAAGIGRPAIVGHSMGGTIAMMLGLREMANRVMVVDMLPAGAAMVGGTASGLGYLADQMSNYLTGTVAGRRTLAQIVGRAPGARGSDPDVIANALRDLAHIDLGPQLARLTVPLEVVYAIGQDQTQAVAIANRFRSAYAPRKGAVLRAIGPSGHRLMVDQPARFNQALTDFLKPG